MRIFAVVDDCTREALCLAVDSSFPGVRVAAALDTLAATQEYPADTVCDNGPELISRTMAIWAAQHDVQLRHIQPGKTNQNAFVERLNGRVRDECLNQHWFLSLADARCTLVAFLSLYDTARSANPRRSLLTAP